MKPVPNLCSNKIFYPNGELVLEEVQIHHLKSLADIVYHTHFYINYELKEDLLQIGLLKALALLRQGHFDPSKGALKNYLYTGMRNVMKAYVTRSLKETPVEEAIMATNESFEISNLPEFPYELIDTLPKDVRCAVEISLLNLGLDIKPRGTTDLDLNSTRVAMAQAIVLHKFFNRNLYYL